MSEQATLAPVLMPARSRWVSIGGSLFLGLFVAYLDRTNLSVALPSLSKDLGFAGADFADKSSWALTTFLIGYAVANVLGGLFTRRMDPKRIVLVMVGIWSVATIAVGFTTSFVMLLVCRFVLGLCEGVYWPQMSRFARGWFEAGELTKANSVIQYYGQFVALALGFLLLTPIYDTFGWRALFWLTGGIGLLVIVPLYLRNLRPEREAPFAAPAASAAKEPLTFATLGGWAFVLLVLAYITQGMLFWGITLWIPLAAKAMGFTGYAQAVASALPYAAAVFLAIPMSRLSDRTGKRVEVAAAGLLIPGLMLLALPHLPSGAPQMALIVVAMGLYASSFTPNVWSILQLTVRPSAVGTASGIMNGLGAGGGGTLAGFLVGALTQRYGDYAPGFALLGFLTVLGSVLLMASGRLTRRRTSLLDAQDVEVTNS